MKLFSNFRKEEKGFTLIEILVVVIIIAILAAVAAPIYFGYVEKAKKSEAEAVVQSIVNSAKIRYNEKGTWPTSIEKEDLGIEVEQVLREEWEFEIIPDGNNVTVRAVGIAPDGSNEGIEVAYSTNTGYISSDDDQ
ncbi:MAG: prepilin-type N-terminal cleavage/methylation domain-containing protein [Calditrichaeota bacterium]|nr:MAG: prepilin-type N-terminal cleavage/methylation domain-containing protein [Calditrichota bacterium]